MNDENLSTAAFVYHDEIAKWKLVKHRFDNVHAVRDDGELIKCANEDYARDVVKRRAVMALLNFYHETMADDHSTSVGV